MEFSAIDAHAHCGIQDCFPPQGFEDYLSQAGGSGIIGAVFIPPVIEIYNRYDPNFVDSPTWQQKRTDANDYLLTLGTPDFEVFPFFFIWNDFAVEQLTSQHRGIKWHRHADEPHYRYDDPRCGLAIEEIRRRNLPVCLEEEMENTLLFVNELAFGVRVIIPHLGLLNGGYERLSASGIWDRPNVFTNTSLAPSGVVMDYIQKYGHERLMFGSDFPFGDPLRELAKNLKLPISEEVKRAIIELNIRRLLADSTRCASPEQQ